VHVLLLHLLALLLQGIMLLLVGPYIDQTVSQRWIADYSWSSAALQQLLLSCGLAVLVNVSQFMCLGRFSAVTFQVGGLVLGCAVASHWIVLLLLLLACGLAVLVNVSQCMCLGRFSAVLSR
jgi:hypothetical protein